MNLCIVSGKVSNEIELKFVYNKAKKSLSKKHISIVMILLELENRQVLLLKAYNEIADFIYQQVHKEDFILIQGKLRGNYVEVECCKIV